MIIALGIDSIEISRFNLWHQYPQKTLLKVFSAVEIGYCLSNKIKNAERFAVRFAAKEAFFKAFSTSSTQKAPFLTICKKVEIIHNQLNAPYLQIQWDQLSEFLIHKETIHAHLSLTHNKSYATAVVVLERINKEPSK